MPDFTQLDARIALKKEAEFEALREHLLADARGTFSEMAKRAFIQAADAVDAARERVRGGGA
mgnify:CR=1 FL=1